MVKQGNQLEQCERTEQGDNEKQSEQNKTRNQRKRKNKEALGRATHPPHKNMSIIIPWLVRLFTSA